MRSCKAVALCLTNGTPTISVIQKPKVNISYQYISERFCNWLKNDKCNQNIKLHVL